MTLPRDGSVPPRLGLFGAAGVHAPTGAEAAAFDRHAIETLGVPQATLMENAGRCAAEVLHRLFPSGPVLCLVGSGNNGGDGLVLLRTLAARGRRVSGIVVGDRPAHEALLHRWNLPLEADAQLRENPEAYDRALAGAAVIVDAVLGTGLKGPPRERQAAAIAAINRSGRPVLSLDLPSGIDADGGHVPGEAVRADVTVAFGFPKLGTLIHPARGRAGRIVAVDIGFPPVSGPATPDFPFGATLITPGWAAARLPRRVPATHKNEVGALLLLAGGTGMAGAAVLAARAAFRAGVGLVRVASDPGNRVILQAALPEAIFLDRTDAGALAEAMSASHAVVAGPGMGTGDDAGEALRGVLRSDVPLLLDADALNLVAAGATPPLAQLAGERPLLLTPHPGEMARISSFSADAIAADRPGVTRAAAASFGCALLLKGTPSIVASPPGPLLIDTVGTSDLATAGMGDVLSGVAGAFLAQGCAPRTAGALALHCTGSAAVRAEKGVGLMPSDVIEGLPDVFRMAGDGESELADLAFVRFDQDAPR